MSWRGWGDEEREGDDVETYFVQRRQQVVRQEEAPLMSDADLARAVRLAAVDKAGEAVILLAYKYAPLRLVELLDLVGLDATMVERLVRYDFLRELRLGLGRGEALVLGEAGRALLRKKLKRRKVDDQVARYTKFGNWLHHDTRVADFMVPFLHDVTELGGSGEWLTPRANPDPEGFKVVRWDAYGYFDLYGQDYSFVLEADCGTEENPKFAAKIARYQTYLAEFDWRGALQVRGDYLPILVATTGGEERLQNMRRAVTKRLAASQHSEQQRWFFTTYDRLAAAPLRNPLYAPVWDSFGDVGHVVLDYHQDLQAASMLAEKLLDDYDIQVGTKRAETGGRLLELHRVLPLLRERVQRQ